MRVDDWREYAREGGEGRCEDAVGGREHQHTIADTEETGIFQMFLLICLTFCFSFQASETLDHPAYSSFI